MTRLKKTASDVALTLLASSSAVFAETTGLVNNPAAYVSSTETGQYSYQGYMCLRTNVNVAGYIYRDGWIKYIGPSSSKQASVQRTGHELYEGHLSFTDSLNPVAKKPRFVYDFTKDYVGAILPVLLASNFMNRGL